MRIAGREASQPPRPDVVLVMGFGATHACWGPQLEELLGSKNPGDPPRYTVASSHDCLIRHPGRISVPFSWVGMLDLQAGGLSAERGC